MLKSSAWIKEKAVKEQLIEPFIGSSVRDGVISYGLGPFGYDIRLDHEYKQLISSKNGIDPHNISDNDYSCHSEKIIEMSPGSYILGKSFEYFKIPEKILGLVFGKSTYARCGILVNVTPLEPGWEGYITLSISNISGNKVTIYPEQGIAQVIFIESDSMPLYSYGDLKGKYNKQDGVTVPKI